MLNLFCFPVFQLSLKGGCGSLDNVKDSSGLIFSLVEGLSLTPGFTRLVLSTHSFRMQSAWCQALPSFLA